MRHVTQGNVSDGSARKDGSPARRRWSIPGFSGFGRPGLARPATLGMDIDGEIALCEAAPGLPFTCRQAVVVRPDGDSARQESDLTLDEHVQRYAQGLRDAVTRHGWHGRRVALSPPLEHLVLRHVALPRMPARALRTAVKLELERRIHLPFDDPVYDFHVAQAGRIPSTELNAIVVAAPRQEVMPWVRLCSAAGLRPVAVEPALLGMARVLVREPHGDSDIDVLVSLGFGGIGLGVLQGEDLVFMRHIAVRPGDYAREATGEQAIVDSYATDVGYELDRSLAFIQYNLLKQGQSVRGVVFLDKVGMGARVASVLGDRVDVPVGPAQLSFVMDHARDRSASSGHPDLSDAQLAGAAMGLALREVTG